MRKKVNVQMSQRLRKARFEAGFTTATQAILRYSFIGSTYRAHENGQNRFTIEYAKSYGRAFNVNPSWLLIGDYYSENITQQNTNKLVKVNDSKIVNRSEKIYALAILLKDDSENLYILEKIKEYVDAQIFEIR